MQSLACQLQMNFVPLGRSGDYITADGHYLFRATRPVLCWISQKLLDAFYSVCNHCGSEQTNAAQTRANKRAMIAFKKRVDGLLTGAEVRALRERLGITQVEAARIFGGGPVAFSKYESDDVTQSEAMDKLLRLADAVPAAFEYLAHAVDAQPHIPNIESNESRKNFLQKKAI